MTTSYDRYKGKRRGLRWPLVLGILALHLLALYGLSRAFAPTFTASIEREIVSAFTITTPPEPPPPPPAPPEPDEGAQGDPGEAAVPEPITVPPAPVKRDPVPRPQASSTGTAARSGARETGAGTGAAGEGAGTGSGAGGTGQGNGRAIATRPSVRSGNLDTATDFPVPPGGRESRFGRSVTVTFTVTRDGRARGCSVARTQVDPQTTAQVCPLVVERIRFNPARTRAGDPVEARYGYRVDFDAR